MTRMLFVILSMALSTNLSSPIFPVYQAAYGLSTAMITMLFAVYAVGVLLMLLAGGALAERMGSRSVALLGVGLAGASALVFLAARGPAALFAGRLIGGLAVGAFMGTSNTLLLQMTMPDQRDRIMGYSASLNLFGFGLGPALGGIWVRFSPGNTMWAPFVVLLGVLAAAFLSVLSIKPRDETPTSSVRVPFRLGVPSEGRALFWGVVGPAVFTGFGFGGIAFALLPGLVRSALGPAGRGIGRLAHFPYHDCRGARPTAAEARRLAEPARLGARFAWRRELARHFRRDSRSTDCRAGRCRSARGRDRLDLPGEPSTRRRLGRTGREDPSDVNVLRLRLRGIEPSRCCNGRAFPITWSLALHGGHRRFPVTRAAGGHLIRPPDLSPRGILKPMRLREALLSCRLYILELALRRAVSEDLDEPLRICRT